MKKVDKISKEGRNLSHTARRSARYKNPNGPSKYFEPYKNLRFIIMDEDVSPEDVDVPVAPLRDELNEDIWTSDNVLKPEVRQALLDIANSYFESLDLDELKVKDVYFTGSLANYGWTNGSDIDLHLIVDYGKLKDISFLEDYLYLKKKNWLDRHDIKIHGFEVEPFAKDEETEHDYKAIYSVLKNEWVVEPRSDKPTIDFETVKEKSASIMNNIDRILSMDDEDKKFDAAEKLKNKLGGLRSIGLSKSGEYSNENLIFKTLRRVGYLDKLGVAKNKAFDSKFTIEELRESKKPRSIKENFELKNLGATPMVHTLKVQKGIEGMTSDKIEIIKDFISFVCAKLKMEEPVKVYLKKGRDDYIATTASYVPSKNENHIRCGGRATVDVLRSIAHELVHNRQREVGIFDIGEQVQNIGGKIEDQANSVAGIFIKDFSHNYGYDNIYDF